MTTVATKSEIQRQINLELGNRCNIIFGDIPNTTSLSYFLIRGYPNQPKLEIDTSSFSVAEIFRIDSAILACLRAGINTPGALQDIDLQTLVSQKAIGPNRAVLLYAAFKCRPTSNNV